MSFFNHWDAIFRILEYPHYFLVNNETERALRQHWIILCKVIQGTQSDNEQRTTWAIAGMIATGKRYGQDFVKNIKSCVETVRGVLNHLSYKPLCLSR